MTRYSAGGSGSDCRSAKTQAAGDQRLQQQILDQAGRLQPPPFAGGQLFRRRVRRGRSQPDQALLHRLEHRFAAGMDLELAVDVLDMPGHGLARQAEMAGDLGVAEALGDAPEDVDLARRQFGGVERGARAAARACSGSAAR